MKSVRDRLRDLWFRLRGVDPEAVVVHFWSGGAGLAREMTAEAVSLIPDRRHYVVATCPAEPIAGTEWIAVQPGSAWAMRTQVARALQGRRVGSAPVLFDDSRQHRALRLAAFLVAPTKILAFNRRLERHHLKPSTAIASFLFWRGVPLDRIWLRPRGWRPRKDRTTIPLWMKTIPGRELSRTRARVAVLSPYLPYPLSHGGAVRMFHLLREAALEFDIFLFAFAENDKEDPGPLREFCAQIVLCGKPRYREPRWSTLAPPETREYTSPVMKQVIPEVMRENLVRLLQTEFTQLATYGGQILVEHDVTFDLYRQIHERKQTLASWWDLWRWQRFETAALRRAERVVVMSEKDAGLCGHPRTSVIPNGVDLARFAPSPEPTSPSILFVGSFRHFPNAVAFRWFLEHVWPDIRSSLPEARWTAVAGPSPELYWMQATGERRLPSAEGLTIHGFVADVKPLYDQAQVVVVPTLESAGTNLKVLEAMATERAVVSTPSGCAGIGLEHEVSALIAETPADFAVSVVRLLRDEGLRRAIAQRARALADRYSWARLGKAQRDLWHEFARAPMDIRPASDFDLPAIGRIQAASREAAQWPPTDYLSHRAVIANLNGLTCGFAVARTTVPGEMEILNLAVLPEWRHHGVARRLVEALLENHAGSVFLEVRESNQAAQEFYRCLGFQERGRRASYYRDPEEAGIVLGLLKC